MLAWPPLGLLSWGSGLFPVLAQQGLAAPLGEAAADHAAPACWEVGVISRLLGKRLPWSRQQRKCRAEGAPHLC